MNRSSAIVASSLFFAAFFLSSCWRFSPVDPTPDSPTSDTITTVGLVAYFPLDGNAKDASGNGFHGEERNNVTYGEARNEWAGRAAIFDGNSAYIRVANAADSRLEMKEAFTQSVWVKGFRKQGKYSWSYILTKAAPFGNGYYMKWNHNGEGMAALYLVTGAQGTTTPWDVVGLPNSEFTGAWHHLLFTWSKERARMELYVDGMLREVQENCRYDGRHSGEALEIGGFAYTGTNTNEPVGSFPGAIDDVRIYDRVLSRSEISALAKEGR
ncbi:MAG TPA: LamG domain-containing protein [Candidatus Didemnitutus sp.]|nr:LamG domain-containing protein [Candidatus Didemnitutus sp.]